MGARAVGRLLAAAAAARAAGVVPCNASVPGAAAPRFVFVRGFGGTGTGLAAKLLGQLRGVDALAGVDPRHPEHQSEGQYAQTVFPTIKKRTARRCGGSIATCDALVDEWRGRTGELRARLCAEWAPHWRGAPNAAKLEKTPDLAVRALAALFPAQREAAVVLVARHPLFWHHARHCAAPDPTCVVGTWARLVRSAIRALLEGPLVAVVARYEDLVSRGAEVLASVAADLGLATSRRLSLRGGLGLATSRRLSLRGRPTRALLWQFSDHDGRDYAPAVRDCLAAAACAGAVRAPRRQEAIQH